MPYALDLVRLAASAVLADATRHPIGGRHLRRILARLSGRHGKAEADRARSQSRAGCARFVVNDEAREEFWDEVRSEQLEPQPKGARPTAPTLRSRRCDAALPEAGPDDVARASRAQAGHRQPRPPALGRRSAQWRGDRSCARRRRSCRRLDTGAWRLARIFHPLRRDRDRSHRAPDPWLPADRATCWCAGFRRTTSRSRAKEKDDRRRFSWARRMHKAMGRELAGIHLGSVDRSAEIARDLNADASDDAGDPRRLRRPRSGRSSPTSPSGPRRIPQPEKKAQEGQQGSKKKAQVVAPMTPADPTDQQNALLRRRRMLQSPAEIKGETPMPRPSVADKRRTFRKLHESGCWVIPNPWDVGSARYLQGLGFKALASTSSGFAWAVAHADNAVGVDMVLAHLAEIVAATDVPVNADFEGGYADDPDGRRQERHALLRDRRRRPVDRGFDRQQGQAALRHAVRGRAHEGGARRDRQGGRRGACSPAAPKASSRACPISSR